MVYNEINTYKKGETNNLARESSITFYKNVNLDKSTGNTYYFANRTAQSNFFASKAYKTVTGVYYQRENRNYVRVYETMGSMLECDYLSFINPQYENKRFYCFITGVTYINDRCQEISYEIDYLQTWLLDLTLKPCMIDRNHSATDALFENLLPESFDMGEAVVNQFTNYSPTRFSAIFQATFDVYAWIASGFYTKTAPKEYLRDDLFDGYSMVGVEVYKTSSVYATNGSAFAEIINAIFTGSGGVTLEDFTDIWIYPSEYLTKSGVATCPNTTASDVDICNYWKVTGADIQNVTLGTLPTSFDGYTPKNNKMKTYPYCFIHVSNNTGSAVDYRFERFAPTDAGLMDRYSAWIRGTTQNEAKIRLSPRNYAGVYDANADDLNYHGYLKLNYEESIDSQSFPLISLIGDVYNIYYAQNRNKIMNYYESEKRQLYSDVFSFIANPLGSIVNNSASSAPSGSEGASAGAGASGGAAAGAGAVAAIAVQKSSEALAYITKKENSIKAVTAEQDDMRMAPNTAKGLQSEGLAFQAGYKAFLFLVKTIDNAHAKMIDDFWSIYGYPVRKIGNPGSLLNNRASWTYIKTAGCSSSGTVPEYVKSIIETLFDAGLTFWNPTKTIGDYSQANGTIS